MIHCACHFCKAGKKAARGETAVYRKPQPASENDELTAALINMRKAAAHNYPGKKEKQNE